MRRKTLALVSIMALAIGVSLFAAPPISRADTIITDITVTNATGGNFTGGAAGNTWHFAPITLTPGQTLVLTQNQDAKGPSSTTTGLPGFNFDTSENAGIAAGQYTVTVTDTKNGAKAFVDNSGPNTTKGVLSDSGNDSPASVTQNEAANWVKIGGVAGAYDLYVAYADTLHSDACQDGAGTGTCLPFSATNLVWDGTGGSTAATVFLGHASNIPGYAGTKTHCNFDETVTANFNCWDAGALLIVSTVPEPGALALVGTALVGVALWARRRLRGLLATA